MPQAYGVEAPSALISGFIRSHSSSDKSLVYAFLFFTLIRSPSFSGGSLHQIKKSVNSLLSFASPIAFIAIEKQNRCDSQ